MSGQTDAGSVRAWTINGFCDAHGICRATFYNLLKRGAGPAVMKVGSHYRISVEAAAEWRRRMEAGAEQKAAA